MTASARVIAQAKVNLLLHVLAREASGYHSIETVFLRLDWGDDVRVRVANGRTVDCTGPAMPATGLGPVEKNLAYRAGAAYSEATGWPAGFAIEIEKRIPVGGGLGGGSADAGAVLRALDAMAPNPLGPRLVGLAAALGADVPFLSMESPMALAWGRGERLLPLHPLESRPLVVLVPEFSVGTAEAYGWLASARGAYESEARVIQLDMLATWEAVAAVAANDFERVVSARHPEVAELVDELASFDATVAMMSGSGSAVFGVFDALPDAAAIARSTGHSPILTRTADRVVRVAVEG
ncbi:MAG TPA: 4-(cytidine 5'-diphospho)-2-C-methyl-D-erythritol kinase [Gemmatimonadaceae bacterium]|jgi:4-diphosphocytidyl-2-C-methyl-D-erythritol kinase|nr:4-(cytidine 5'-diphospho)-2-C-methyl-D-erythritol kinase [Gemmatimonadaceae bacterium]